MPGKKISCSTSLMSAKVQDLMQITKLITVFESFSNEPAALRSFADPATAG